MSVVGCPTAESWPGVDRRPGYTLHFPAWQNHSEISVSSGADSPRANVFPRIPDAHLARVAQENQEDGLLALDLLQGLLTLDPKQRMTAADALRHPLLADLLAEEEEQEVRSVRPDLPFPARTPDANALEAVQKGGGSAAAAAAAIMSPPVTQPRQPPQQRTRLPRASKRTRTAGTPAPLEASWADGLPDSVWAIIGRALIRNDSAPLDGLTRNSQAQPQPPTSRPHCTAVWLYSVPSTAADLHPDRLSYDDMAYNTPDGIREGTRWVACAAAVREKLESGWQQWRTDGSVVGDIRCEVSLSPAVRNPAARLVDFTEMKVGRRNPVAVARFLRENVKHNEPDAAALPTSDESAKKRLSVLSSRTVCRTWNAALTPLLLCPTGGANGFGTLQPRTPRVADQTRPAKLGRGLMGDPIALMHLRTISARRVPVAPLPKYAWRTSTITAAMRGILVDWLFEVSEAYHVTRGALHGCAKLLDVALYAAEAEAAPVPRENLQLLGVCCMLLAAKQQESSYPSVGKLCYITDNAYTPQAARAMERMTAAAVNFHFGLAMAPTAYTALRLVLPPHDTQAGWADEASPQRVRLEALANYFCDLTLTDQDFTAERPMEVAEACLVLAAASLGVACPPLPPTPECFLDGSISTGTRTDAASPTSAASSTAALHADPATAARLRSEAGGAHITDIRDMPTTSVHRRARLMKKLHNLHRLAWARCQPNKAELLSLSPELAAAELTSRTDAVTDHYRCARTPADLLILALLMYSARSLTRLVFLLCLRSRSRWEEVATTAVPLTCKELCAKLEEHALTTPPSSPGFELANDEWDTREGWEVAATDAAGEDAFEDL